MAGPRTNLAALLDQAGQGGDSRATARAAALRREELPLLARDANLAPDNATVQYRYAMALVLGRDYQAALEPLRRAVQLAPEIDDYQLALRLLKEELVGDPQQ